MPLASAQVQFSLLSKGPEQMETLAICRDLGIAVIAYSPLGLGAHLALECLSCILVHLVCCNVLHHRTFPSAGMLPPVHTNCQNWMVMSANRNGTC